jgi:hypothetical protein
MEYLNMRPEHVAQVAELEKLCFSAPWSENAVRLNALQDTIADPDAILHEVERIYDSLV